MENYIYEKDFRNILTRNEFNFLFSSAKSNRLRENSSNIICDQNENSNKIFYFAIIPLYSHIDMKKNNILINCLTESSWYGVLELATQMDKFIYPHSFYNKLNINSYERYDFKKKSNHDCNYFYSLSVKNKNYDIVYYEWSKDV